MQALTLKLPSTLDAQVAHLAAREHISKSELVRQALSAYVQQKMGQASEPTALDAVHDLVGCFKGGPEDLSTNPAHLAEFGRR